MGPEVELLERDAELAAIEARLADAGAGEGGLLVIEGPAGVGKTALLRAALAMAQARGMRALCAWAGPLEQDLPFGVAREIFEPVRAAMPEREWETVTRGAAGLASSVLDVTDHVSTGSGWAAVHGLYWLTANLAMAGPVVIAVDDVQWADPGSLRWLAYLARRLDGVPVLVVATVNTGEGGRAPELLAEVLAPAVWAPLRPAHLGEAAAEDLVRRVLTAATPGFCRACHGATGGNPFLLRALATSMCAEGVEPSDATAREVEEFGPDSVAAALDRRLGRLPAGARPFLDAVAVLGSAASLRHCAALAGLNEGDAAHVADALLAAGVLRSGAGLEFVHPVVRSAVSSRPAPGARGLAHRRAARLLAADGAPVERLAIHLLQTHPAADPWVVTTLRNAATTAAARGTPEAAERYLRRALVEPPAPDVRPFVLHELGVALIARRDPEAPRLFQEAVDVVTDPVARGEIALSAARGCNLAMMLPESVAISRAGLRGEASLEPATRLRLEAEMLANLWLDEATADTAWDWLERGGEEPATGTTADALPLVLRAGGAISRGGRAVDAVALLEAAIAAGVLEERGSIVHSMLMYQLINNDELDTAARVAGEIRAWAQRLASVSLVAHCSYMEGLLAYRRGALAEAESEVRMCLEFNRDAGTPLGATWALALLVDVLCARGELGAADTELQAYPLELTRPRQWSSALLLQSRGALRCAQGRCDEGLADLEEARRLWAGLGVGNPAVLAGWWVPAARALVRLGRRAEARRLATENLDLARANGLPRVVGVALCTVGVVDDDRTSLGVAVELLQGTDARLELARALVDHGAALRRNGQRAEARERLGMALDIASRCGAGLLATEARDELRIAGGRPRRLVRSGVDALTPQERRVARLAADGLSNRQIAQCLFVSERTVETHMLHVFQKLGVANRSAVQPSLFNDAVSV